MVETIGIDLFHGGDDRDRHAFASQNRSELLPQLPSLKTVHRTVFETLMPEGSTLRLQNKKRQDRMVLSFLLGGDDRDRTDYLLNAIQALSQVSYAPKGTSQPRLNT